MSASTKLFVVKVFQNGTVAFLKGFDSKEDRKSHHRKVVREAVLTDRESEAMGFDSEAAAGYAASGIQGGMAVKG